MIVGTIKNEEKELRIKKDKIVIISTPTSDNKTIWDMFMDDNSRTDYTENYDKGKMIILDEIEETPILDISQEREFKPSAIFLSTKPEDK